MITDARALLWLAIEDCAGLWEAIWKLRSLHPDESEDQVRGKAREVVLDLVAAGFIDSFHCQEPYGEMAAIDPAAVRRELFDDRRWKEPAPLAISVRFSATPTGERSYLALERDA